MLNQAGTHMYILSCLGFQTCQILYLKSAHTQIFLHFIKSVVIIAIFLARIRSIQRKVLVFFFHVYTQFQILLFFGKITICKNIVRLILLRISTESNILLYSHFFRANSGCHKCCNSSETTILLRIDDSFTWCTSPNVQRRVLVYPI